MAVQKMIRAVDNVDPKRILDITDDTLEVTLFFNKHVTQLDEPSVILSHEDAAVLGKWLLEVSE